MALGRSILKRPTHWSTAEYELAYHSTGGEEEVDADEGLDVQKELECDTSYIYIAICNNILHYVPDQVDIYREVQMHRGIASNLLDTRRPIIHGGTLVVDIAQYSLCLLVFLASSECSFNTKL